MNKSVECLEAMKQASDEGKALYRQCQKSTIGKKFPSLPGILRGCMDKVKEMEEMYMKQITDLVYGHDEDGVCVCVCVCRK